MAIDTADPSWLTSPKQLDDGDEAGTAWAAGLYSLHGPPGLPPASLLSPYPRAPFVEPRTVPFPVRISDRDLSALLAGCNCDVPERDFSALQEGYDPNLPASPWQDVDGAAALSDPYGTGDVPENKWVIYSAEVDGIIKVRMYRSWTGIKLIELTIDDPPPPNIHENAPALEDDGAPGTTTKEQRTETYNGPRITHITFETHEDYKLKGANELLYKFVAAEVCWWLLGVCFGPETDV